LRIALEKVAAQPVLQHAMFLEQAADAQPDLKRPADHDRATADERSVDGQMVSIRVEPSQQLQQYPYAHQLQQSMAALWTVPPYSFEGATALILSLAELARSPHLQLIQLELE